MVRKQSKYLFAVLLLITALSATTYASQVTLKMGTSYPKNSPDGKGADYFAQLVSQRTNGQLQVEVFPMEQLGNANTMLESTMIGNQDILMEAQSRCERFAKAARIGMVNYTFKNRSHFQKYILSDLYSEYVTKYVEEAGLKFLDTKGTFQRGPFRIMISKRPILAVDDLKGLRLRMWDSDSARRSWEAFGAVTIHLPWGEVYLGLKQGMVEAVTSPVDLLWAMKFTEQARFITRTEEFPQIIRIYMNLRKFNSLKPEFQKVLIDSANEAGDYYTELSKKAASENIDKVIKEHNAVYIQLNLEPFRAVMPPVIKQFEKEGFLPVGLYDKIQALAH